MLNKINSELVIEQQKEGFNKEEFYKKSLKNYMWKVFPILEFQEILDKYYTAKAKQVYEGKK